MRDRKLFVMYQDSQYSFSLWYQISTVSRRGLQFSGGLDQHLNVQEEDSDMLRMNGGLEQCCL